MALVLKTRKDLASGGSLRTTQLAGISFDVVRTQEGRWTMEDLSLRVETPAGTRELNLMEAIEQQHAREVASSEAHSHRP